MTIAIGGEKRNKRTQRRHPAEWLALAASPVFALMALYAANTAADPICSAMKDPLPFDGMAFMYLLMCLFHMSPWMKRRSTPHPLSKEIDR